MDQQIKLTLSLYPEAIATALSALSPDDLSFVLQILATECVDPPKSKPKRKKLSAYEKECVKRQAVLWDIVLTWSDEE
jgi:hypothetical protein